MRKIKFILSLLFVFLLSFTLFSCKKPTEEPIKKPTPSTEKPTPVVPVDVNVGIKGSTEVKSGKETKYTAYVDGVVSTDVTWEVKSGSEYVTISENGTLTAEEVTGDKIVEIIARSNKNKDCFGSKIVTVVAKPTLTQSMLDALNVDKIGFEGYLNISVYDFGVVKKLKSTYTTVVKTAMDGTNWYAEYENGDTGTTMGLYFKNHDNLACKVGVSFLNDEEYEPMLDGAGKKVDWESSGLYNAVKDLRVSDFRFNEDTWRYEYKSKGKDDLLTKKLIAAANPYDFEQDPNYQFQLIMDEEEVLGFYVKSSPNYTIVEQYEAIQELFVAIGFGETITVPKITKYPHYEFHDDLQNAINYMQSLNSYNLDFYSITASYLTSGLVKTGFTETVTENDCYFKPYTMVYDEYGLDVREYSAGKEYGYHKINDVLYNSFHTSDDLKFEASRAFNDEFINAKPSFGFAAEIFTSYHENEDGSVSYYTDELMTPVASTWYYGVGNDINLYGIFATKGYLSQTSSFTPFVTVKDGKIISACFYFYLGSMYGIVELTYSDFNEAEIPSDVVIDFTTRNVPTSWNELTIIKSNEANTTLDDEEVNAMEFLKDFFLEKSNLSFEETEQIMPFFGDVLGDTYGFGMMSLRIPDGKNIAHSTITMYYDVPLGTDYTIDEPLAKIKDLLISKGFEKTKDNEYYKDGIYISPVDSSLDLIIYVWGQKY